MGNFIRKLAQTQVTKIYDKFPCKQSHIHVKKDLAILEKIPVQQVCCHENFEKIPDEILTKIILELDYMTFFKSLPHICKRFKKFYVEKFHEFCVSSRESFPFQLYKKSLFLEVARNLKRIATSLKISEGSNEKQASCYEKKSEKSTRFYPGGLTELSSPKNCVFLHFQTPFMENRTLEKSIP